MAQNIFKNGPGPELEAEWDRLEKLEEKFYSAHSAERKRMLKEFPELRHMVLCEECGQVLPEPLDWLG